MDVPPAPDSDFSTDSSCIQPSLQSHPPYQDKNDHIKVFLSQDFEECRKNIEGIRRLVYLAHLGRLQGRQEFIKYTNLNCFERGSDVLELWIRIEAKYLTHKHVSDTFQSVEPRAKVFLAEDPPNSNYNSKLCTVHKDIATRFGFPYTIKYAVGDHERNISGGSRFKAASDEFWRTNSVCAHAHGVFVETSRNGLVDVGWYLEKLTSPLPDTPTELRELRDAHARHHKMMAEESSRARSGSESESRRVRVPMETWGLCL